MSSLEVLLVVAVLVGMSVQAAIGFGFALIVAPAAFAALSPERAVTLVVLLAIAINVLVLFTERRRRAVAGRVVATILVAAVPGVVAGAWLLERADRELLQLLVGVVVVAAAVAQAIASRRPAPPPAPSGSRPVLELGGGLAAGTLTTSVSINGPVLVLVFTRLGLRGERLRDSLAAALLGLALIALPVLLIGSEDAALPDGWVALACVPALLVGHRFGAAVFARLGDRAHARIVLIAAGLAGALSIGAALLG
ncbi:MAG: TSUP family transporter [Solirubrobacterales bacterium]